MSIKDFFMSYLTPFYLMYRVAMVMYAGGLFLLGNSAVASQAGLNGWGVDVYIYGLIIAVALFAFLRCRVWWLYLWIPTIMLVLAMEMAKSTPSASMAMVNTSAFLLLINAFRFWNYGVSLNDINQTLKKYTKR